MSQTPESAEQPAIPPANHQTVSAYETHLVGPDMRPISHSVVQGIIALQPLERILYVVDTDEIERITGGRGCTAGEQRPINDKYHMAELILTKPLGIGERTTLEHTTWFNYAVPPEPEYRRRVGANAMSVLDICVQFKTGHEPHNIWEAQWESLESGSPGEPSSKIEVPLQDSPTSGLVEVRRQETDVPPGTILGYRWEW